MSKRTHLLKRLLSSRRLGTHLHFFLDRLEERQLMSTVTWTGLGATSNWSDAANWDTNASPNAGDTLLFPAGSGNTNSVNDLASGFVLQSLQFTGGNYHLSGNSFTLQGGFSVTPDGVVQIDNDISTPDNSTVTISETGSPQLILNGVLSIGNGGIIDASIYSVLQLGGSATPTTGSIHVSHGTAIVSGSYSNAFEVASTGDLLDEGSVGAVANHGGMVMATAFTVNVAGDLTQDTNSNLSLNYEGSGLNSNLTVDGDVTLHGSLSATFYYTPAPGEVLTVINNTGSNQVTGTFDNLPEGATVSLGGNDYTISYQGGDGNDVTLSRTPDAAAVTLTVPSSATYGQSFDLTAGVADGTDPNGLMPTGTVTFFDGQTSLGTVTLDPTGSATLSTGTIPAGDHTLTATYNGDTSHLGASSTGQSLTVNQAQPTLNLSNSGNTIVGNNFTVTGTLTGFGVGQPTGFVAFFDFSQPLGQVAVDANGVATVTETNPAVGMHEVFAVYDGDNNYLFSDSPANIITISPPATTAALTGGGSSNYGDSASFTATISGVAGTPTGTVTFMDGANEMAEVGLDENGQASFSRTTLLPGSHTITAVYNGDDANAASTSSAVTQIVGKATPGLALTTTSSTVPQGRSVTLTLTVSRTSNVGAEPQGGTPGLRTPTGSVSFYDGSTLLDTVAVTPDVTALPQGDRPIADAAASLTLANLPLGANGITAIYNGDDNFTALTADPVTVTVQPVTSPVVTAALTDVHSPGAAKYIFTLTFTDPNGVNVLPLISSPTVSVTGPAHFAQMATFLGVTTTAAGLRTVTFRIKPPGGSWNADDAGTYTVHVAANAVNDGQGNWLSATAAGTFYMSPTPFFDERFYLAHNPGVAAAVDAGIQSSGYAHFIGWGQFEGRDPSPFYNEARYLALHPDVARQVAAGIYKSGFDQFTHDVAAAYRQLTAFSDQHFYQAAAPAPVLLSGETVSSESNLSATTPH